jgi:hypothetical protein
MALRKAYRPLFEALRQGVEYETEVERRFFEAIKNPPAPSERLKEMVRKFGPFAFGNDPC